MITLRLYLNLPNVQEKIFSALNHSRTLPRTEVAFASLIGWVGLNSEMICDFIWFVEEEVSGFWVCMLSCTTGWCDREGTPCAKLVAFFSSGKKAAIVELKPCEGKSILSNWYLCFCVSLAIWSQVHVGPKIGVSPSLKSCFNLNLLIQTRLPSNGLLDVQMVKLSQICQVMSTQKSQIIYQMARGVQPILSGSDRIKGVFFCRFWRSLRLADKLALRKMPWLEDNQRVTVPVWDWLTNWLWWAFLTHPAASKSWTFVNHLKFVNLDHWPFSAVG